MSEGLTTITARFTVSVDSSGRYTIVSGSAADTWTDAAIKNGHIVQTIEVDLLKPPARPPAKGKVVERKP